MVAAGSGYRLGVWRCSEPEPGPHPPELATSFEIIFPIAGAFVRERDGEREFADCTRVVFENAGEWYRVHHPVAGGDVCTVLTVTEPMAESIAALLERHPQRAVFDRQAVPAGAELYVLHRQLLANAQAASCDPLAMDSLALTVIQRAIGAAGRTAREPTTSVRQREIAVVRALELIHAESHRKITLDEIARYAGYSPFFLSRVFRERMGIPIHRYVTRLRLRASYEAVMDGAADLTRIALSHGFSSHSHLTHAFTREFGAPPSRMRSQRK